MRAMPRSRITVDLGAVRRNAERLLAELGGSELWAVVKADGYGHGAADVSRAALSGGATALCVATVGEGTALRPSAGGVRLIVMGPWDDGEVAAAREADLELVVSAPIQLPDRSPVPEVSVCDQWPGA